MNSYSRKQNKTGNIVCSYTNSKLDCFATFADFPLKHTVGINQRRRAIRMVRYTEPYQKLIQPPFLEKINCEAHDKPVKILRIMRYIHMDHRLMSEFNITTGGTRMKLAVKQKTAEAALHLHNRAVACISMECCKS